MNTHGQVGGIFRKAQIIALVILVVVALLGANSEASAK